MGEKIPVLILVVMEEGQRQSASSDVAAYRRIVLILVVMEEGQRLCTHHGWLHNEYMVLILVVMEEGQRLYEKVADARQSMSLNPCCNGRGSKTLHKDVLHCLSKKS